MKRPVPWGEEDKDSSSSSSDSDAEADKNLGKPYRTTTQVNLRKKQGGAIDFEALKQYGYKGGLSVLNVPQPKEKPNWTWSTGREHREARESEKSSEEQRKPGVVVMDNARKEQEKEKEKEKKNLSFSQKEKRKRELGQASRAKNYVEEEKRLLRESGVYSGFDT